MLKKYFLNLFTGGFALNEAHIIDFCNKYGKKRKWLDVGCDDGIWTKKISNSKKIEWHGIEVVKKRAQLAREKGILVKSSSLENTFPFKENTFDLVHSNQVIEHLFNLDFFIAEIKRVLKPGGVLVISTENPASWHNIFALLMGWQMFTTTNVSTKKRVIGNPFSIHSDKDFSFNDESSNFAWEHNKVLTPRALTELLELHDFKILKRRGAGYHPLPAKFGEMDINHSHFYVIAAVK